MRGWCIIGTVLCDGVASLWLSKEHVPADGTRALKWGNGDGCFDGVLREVVVDARVVHHWDGSLDGVASLWLSKERVPADGTREIWEMAQNHS